MEQQRSPPLWLKFESKEILGNIWSIDNIRYVPYNYYRRNRTDVLF